MDPMETYGPDNDTEPDDEVEAACGHVLSPERDEVPPCEACGRCLRCGERW